LGIWGECASKFDLGPDEHPVIAVKRAMVTDYLGKSLNSNDDSQIIINPPHPRTKILAAWYKFLKDPSALQHVTNTEGSGNKIDPTLKDEEITDS
jgi:hypothetical protein